MSSSICSDSDSSCNDSMNITAQLNDEIKCAKKKSKICHISESLPNDSSNLTSSSDTHSHKCKPPKKPCKDTDSDEKCDDTNLCDVVTDMRSDILRILMLMQKIMNEVCHQNKKIKKASCSHTSVLTTNTCTTTSDDNILKLTKEFDAKLETLKQEIEEETRKIISNNTTVTKSISLQHSRIPKLGNRLQ